jgi:acetyltransferase-like isoleucine patch superfamily enzyme
MILDIKKWGASMSVENFLFKIRRAESPIYARIKKVLLALLYLDFPAPKIIFRPIYELVVLWRILVHFLPEKLFYIPVFKSRCEKCGRGLSLPSRIPWIEGNLRIIIGDKVVIDDNIFISGRAYNNPILIVGDRSSLGHKITISVGKSVQIGNDCLIAMGCWIADNDGHPVDPQRRLNKEPVNPDEVKPVVIEDNVWIGAGCVILKGVTIGKGSVVAANSLVNRSVPPYSVVMGVPAIIIKSNIDEASGKSI